MQVVTEVLDTQCVHRLAMKNGLEASSGFKVAPTFSANVSTISGNRTIALCNAASAADRSAADGSGLLGVLLASSLISAHRLT